DAARLGRGERPEVEEYARAHPDLADLLRRVLPALSGVVTTTGSGPDLDGLLRRVLPDPSPAQSTVPARGATPADSSAPPERLGEHRIVRALGRGRMGVAY